MLLVAISAMAIPAHRDPVMITQPDGSKLTIKLIGDEFYHFNTTTDGYTIVKNNAGVYVYAQRDGQGLKASTVKAHDELQRSDAEKAFLSTTAKYMTDREEHASGEAKRVQRDVQGAGPNKAVSYSKFRGLIILINFTDVKFSMKDPNKFYNDMVNAHGWTGYTDDSGKFVNCTGSMYDYYNENSNGVFQPVFDIIGPVDVNYKSTDMKGTSNAQTIFKAALAAADAKGCDFTKYDTDNNGYVDMVFFQVAGMSSSFGGNNGNWLWPHKSSIWSSPTYDGKRFGTYASSTEIYGFEAYPSTITIEGIGTMCHEFTHVMGFPDLYDTNYETGGQSHHPEEWDIMAGGGSFNSARTPVGYTIFERYALGFANPEVIGTPGHYTLNPVMSNEGYILRSPIAKEYFIIDNRQRTRWDTYLPGHGMIVCRVDSTSTSPWVNNTVNCNPSHNYYEMFRAGNSKTGAQASDPFPGSTGNSQLNAKSMPALATWNGTTMSMGIYNITESNGVIEFDVMNSGEVKSLVEDFEAMPTTTNKTATGVKGVFTTWDFNQCYNNAPGAGKCDGQHAVRMLTPSAFTSATPIYYNAYQVTFEAYNTSSTAAKLALTYSTDGGRTWVKPKSSTGSTPVQVAANSNAVVSWPIEVYNTQGTLFRVQMSAGSKTVPCFIDNFTVFYNGEEGKPASPGDVNNDGVVDINDMNLLINVVLGKDSADTFDGRADVNNDGTVDINDLNILINLILSK